MIKNPYSGALGFFLFMFVFALLYKPVGSHPSRYFNYQVTVLIYSMVSGAIFLTTVKAMKSLKYFSLIHGWTIKKELLSILFSLLAVGIAIYLSAFIIEEPADRWNPATFFDSIKRSFLVGIFPFIFFTALNFRYWFASDDELSKENAEIGAEEPGEELIKITSQLKKEELSFYPSQFIYAVSDSNYVNFFIYRNNQLKKEVIRNSISNVEQQLSKFPYLVRTHRAFIVNIKKIRFKKGNVLGYRLKLTGVDYEIPVARNKTGTFNKLLKQYSQPGN